ncbi:MAG: hypothetical protein RR623_08500 [Bacilli bacterium]
MKTLYKLDGTPVLNDLLTLEDEKIYTNANGSFIKHANGQLECWHTVSSTTQAQAWATLQMCTFTNVWTFPFAFVDNPIVLACPNNLGSNILISTVTSDKTGVSRINAQLEITIGKSITCNFNLKAIGRWK